MKREGQKGKVGYIILGVPVSVLFLIALLRVLIASRLESGS
jgi:hypothetical protein